MGTSAKKKKTPKRRRPPEPSLGDQGLPTFTDKLGRTWEVELTMGSARRVDRSDFSEVPGGKDLQSILVPGKELFLPLLENGPLAMAVVWAIVQPQVPDLMADIPEDQREDSFLEGLDGKAVDAARDALWRALESFFPEHRTALSTFRKQWQRAAKKVNASLEGLEGEMEEMVDQELDKRVNQLRKDLRTELEGGQPGAKSGN